MAPLVGGGNARALRQRRKRIVGSLRGGGEGTIPAPVGHRAMDSQWFENFFSSFVFSFLFFVDVSLRRPLRFSSPKGESVFRRTGCRCPRRWKVEGRGWASQIGGRHRKWDASARVRGRAIRRTVVVRKEG